MPDSGKRKVNTAIYGTMRHDHEPSAAEKAEACVSALREHVDKLRTWKSIRRALCPPHWDAEAYHPLFWPARPPAPPALAAAYTTVSSGSAWG